MYKIFYTVYIYIVVYKCMCIHCIYASLSNILILFQLKPMASVKRWPAVFLISTTAEETMTHKAVKILLLGKEVNCSLGILHLWANCVTKRKKTLKGKAYSSSKIQYPNLFASSAYLVTSFPKIIFYVRRIYFNMKVWKS